MHHISYISDDMQEKIAGNVAISYTITLFRMKEGISAVGKTEFIIPVRYQDNLFLFARTHNYMRILDNKEILRRTMLSLGINESIFEKS
jgi:hypothetical protein